MVAGSVIGFIGLLVPGMYDVSYHPPPGAGYPDDDDPRLRGFDDVFNGFNGPYNFEKVIWPLAFLALLGFVAPLAYSEAVRVANRYVGLLLHLSHFSLSVIAAVSALALFIWDYRWDFTPQSIRDAFVIRLGGGDEAVDASYFVSSSLGAATLVVLLGALVGIVGALAGVTRWIAVGLIVLILVVCCFGNAITSAIPRPGYHAKPTATMAHCLLEHGAVDACTSRDATAKLYLPTRVGSAQCAATVRVDWGDGSPVADAPFAGTTGYLTSHKYTKPGTYTISESATAGKTDCRFESAGFTFTLAG